MPQAPQCPQAQKSPGTAPEGFSSCGITAVKGPPLTAQPIPPAALSQFRTIQHHLLNSEKRQEIKNRIVNILLKLLCFFPAFALWDGWKEQPSPQLIEQAVDTVMENHSGSLYLLFWQEESLLVFEWDALSLSLYHPSQQLLDLAQTIARSEGFFLYQF